MCFAPQRRALFRKSTSEPPKVDRTWCVLYILTWTCTSRQRRALFRKLTSEPPKVDRTWCVLYILTSKCASRHNGVHFFESRHLSLQKWSEHVVFCTFSLGNVLRATFACTFSTSQLPKVVRPCGVLYILTWTCASRHNGVHFFDIATSKSGPDLVCFVHFDLDMYFAPQRRALFRKLTSEPPKVDRTLGVLYILTSKCASRHNGVHFFDIATYKSGPDLVCFVHFHLEMCFAPQRRALFRHRNVQKWSGPGVFCTFSLGNVLRATTACTFSTSQRTKVLYIFTWKCASRHNGVHFFDIATYKSGPDLVCFVHFHLEMCFAPQRRALSHLPSGQLPPHPPL